MSVLCIRQADLPCHGGYSSSASTTSPALTIFELLRKHSKARRLIVFRLSILAHEHRDHGQEDEDRVSLPAPSAVPQRCNRFTHADVGVRRSSPSETHQPCLLHIQQAGDLLPPTQGGGSGSQRNGRPSLRDRRCRDSASSITPSSLAMRSCWHSLFLLFSCVFVFVNGARISINATTSNASSSADSTRSYGVSSTSTRLALSNDTTSLNCSGSWSAWFSNSIAYTDATTYTKTFTYYNITASTTTWVDPHSCRHDLSSADAAIVSAMDILASLEAAPHSRRSLPESTQH